MTGKMMSALAMALALLLPSAAGATTRPPEEARTAAVELARSGDYSGALVLLREVAATGYEGAGFWADYMTVLAWAGEEQELVSLADAHYAGDFTAVPDYALLPIARAYEHTGDIATATRLYQRLAASGNTAAELVAANLLARAGQVSAATAIYDRLRVTNSYAEYEIRYNQALDALARADYVTAERYFTMTRELATAAGELDFIRDMDARRAALYIGGGEPARAIAILRTYTESGTGTPRMTSDYLMALRLNGQLKLAVEVFKKYCPDPSVMPPYGLQTMGDIYMRLGDYRHAHELYSQALALTELPFARLADAYALAILGRRAESMDSYRKALTVNPKMLPAATGDMAALLRCGHLYEARGLAAVLTGLTTGLEQEKVRLRYGQALVENGEILANGLLNFARDERMDGRDYYHEADGVLRPLTRSKDNNIAIAARAALAHNKLNKGLYADAAKAITDLLAEDSDHPEVLKAAAEAERVLPHGLTVSYASNLDNKRNHESTLAYDYSSYMGENTSLINGVGYHRLQDDSLHTSYRTGYIGFSRELPRGSFDLAYDYNWGHHSSHGFSAGLVYDFNDVTQLTYAIARRPHDHAGAVSAGITELAHSARLAYIYGGHWRLGAEYERYFLSDDNSYYRWGLDAVRNITLRHNYRDNVIMSYSYGSYRREVATYDSPYRRVDAGLGISRKWLLPRHERTWELINMLGWGHDNDEATSFAPWTRLELVQTLKAHQQLRAGIEYSWYTNQSDDSRRSSGYRFDVSYYVGW